MPSLKQILRGKKESVKQLPTQTPEQQQLMTLIQEGLTSGEGPFGELFNFDANKFEQGVTKPAIKNFQEQILPMLQEKYIANNQTGGSGVARSKMKAGTDLQERLASLMYQGQQGAQQNKLAGAQTLLGQHAFENLYKPRQVGGLEAFIQSFLGSAGKGLGQKLTGTGDGGGGGGGGGSTPSIDPAQAAQVAQAVMVG